ncbi:MAG: LexA family protein [Gammaproteobacteria bacterium]
MTRKALHTVQSQLLELLKRQSEEQMTIRDLQEAVGASSTSVVVHHLQQLERKGYIKRNPFNPRDYQIMEAGPEPAVALINVYGMASCGPKGSILDGNPIDRVPIGARLLSFPASEAFMVRAKGRSMEPTIHEGDLVIARRTDVSMDGQIFVCVNNEESVIKRLRFDGRSIILESVNREFPPFVAAEDFRVEGEVRQVISRKL